MKDTMQRLVWLALALSFTACNCMPRRPVTDTLKKEGQACSSDDVCETGLCDGVVAAVCVRKCSSECKTEEVCTQLTPGRFSCQPDQRRLCQACLIDADCPYPADKCIVVNNERVCGRDCAYDQSCPMGYICVNGRGSDGQSKAQQCSPMIASCACLARGELMQPCETSNDAGTCRGVKTCDLVGNGITCSAQTPIAELCNGMDDNCDGRIDEGGMVVTCGVGACERSVSSCGDGGMNTCVPGMPGMELCNNIDDNCNGMTDEDFPVDNDVNNCGGCGRVCMLPNATPTCTARTCQVATCNFGFGNCDTLHPNGCEVNTLTNPLHCGGCNMPCTRPNSMGVCVNGACQFQCPPGFVDLNNDPTDGCEYACTLTSPTDLPDLAYTDANCDGIDGELTNGVFVSPNGADTNAGTRAAPKRTLANAVTTAVTGGKRDIYLATGTYTGPLSLSLVSGINVAGGYHPTTWARAQTNQVVVSGGVKALELDSANNVLVQAIRFEGGAGQPTAYGAFITGSNGVQLQALEIRAGNGAPGADGVVGSPGDPGGGGGNGDPACADDRFSGNGFSCSIWSCAVPAAGTAGTSACGYSGGAGGMGVYVFGANSGPGNPGNQAPNGGAPGQGSGGQTGNAPAAPSANGQAGAMGSPGSSGAAGSAGSFSAMGYVLPSGQAGTDGTPGRGGGGGGGGCGGLESVSGCYAHGGGGGGGGGGGCGGIAGRGGLGGGASVGIFLFNSTVTAQNVQVNAGTGGRGGSGGSGGTGGSGGPGGISPYGGTDPFDGDTGHGSACRGGVGGQGGQGGSGGHGGGGTGGPSYGLVRNAASMWTGVGSLVMQGTGGAAGASPGNAGLPGAQAVQLMY